MTLKLTELMVGRFLLFRRQNNILSSEHNDLACYFKCLRTQSFLPDAMGLVSTSCPAFCNRIIHIAPAHCI